jgi:hypothetical protein
MLLPAVVAFERCDVIGRHQVAKGGHRPVIKSLVGLEVLVEPGLHGKVTGQLQPFRDFLLALACGGRALAEIHPRPQLRGIGDTQHDVRGQVDRAPDLAKALDRVVIAPGSEPLAGFRLVGRLHPGEHRPIGLRFDGVQQLDPRVYGHSQRIGSTRLRGSYYKKRSG